MHFLVELGLSTGTYFDITACFYYCRNRLISNMEDQLFYTITEGQEMITLTQFISVSTDLKHQKSFDRAPGIHSLVC